jgi:hypothetical protein
MEISCTLVYLLLVSECSLSLQNILKFGLEEIKARLKDIICTSSWLSLHESVVTEVLLDQKLKVFTIRDTYEKHRTYGAMGGLVGSAPDTAGLWVRI